MGRIGKYWISLKPTLIGKWFYITDGRELAPSQRMSNRLQWLGKYWSIEHGAVLGVKSRGLDFCLFNPFIILF